jgi:hypothetical protein
MAQTQVDQSKRTEVGFPMGVGNDLESASLGQRVGRTPVALSADVAAGALGRRRRCTTRGTAPMWFRLRGIRLADGQCT